MNFTNSSRERDDLIRTAEGIISAAEAAGRDLTEAEITEFDRLMNKADTAKRREQLEAIQPRRIPDEPISNQHYGLAQSSVITAPHPKHTLKAFANSVQGRNDAYRTGQWLLATLKGDRDAERWCLDNGMSPDFRAAHSEGVNSAGGATVPAEMDAVIIALREEYGVFRQHSRVVPMASDTLTIPRRTSG